MWGGGQPLAAADAPASLACACLLAILSVLRRPESPLRPAALELILGSPVSPPPPPTMPVVGAAAEAVGKPGAPASNPIDIMSFVRDCCSSPASPSIAARVPLRAGPIGWFRKMVNKCQARTILSRQYAFRENVWVPASSHDYSPRRHVLFPDVSVSVQFNTTSVQQHVPAGGD